MNRNECGFGVVGEGFAYASARVEQRGDFSGSEATTMTVLDRWLLVHVDGLIDWVNVMLDIYANDSQKGVYM